MKSFLADWESSNRVALLDEFGNTLTYAELHEKVCLFSRRLQSQQVAFLLAQNDMETVIAYLGCLKAGTVPLLLSRDLSPASLSALHKTYSPTYVFSHRSYNLGGIAGTEQLKLGDHLLVECSGGGQIATHPDLGLLLATSGSTGSPKLVRLTQKNIYSNACAIAEYLGINEDQRAITSLPFNYSYGLSVINSHLVAGASLSLTNKSLFDSAFWGQMREQEVSSLSGVPYSYRIMLKLGFDNLNLPKLRTLTQAGGPLERESTKILSEISARKGYEFYVMYGQTEASPRMAYLSPHKLKEKLGSIGRAIPGGTLWLESDCGNRVQIANEPGNLTYSGPNVCLGYAETRKDLSLGDTLKGVLRTGDIARQDEDGFFYIQGRKHRFIKMHGVRIGLDSVEDWLVRNGLTGAAHGKDDDLRVWIEDLPEKTRKQYLSALASDFQIHPSGITLETTKAIPRLSSGKVDYSLLDKNT